MSMTRKDFSELAAIVAEVPGRGIVPEVLADKLADFCSRQNPRFDRARFIEACDLPPE